MSAPVAAQAQPPLRIAYADPASSLDPQLNNNAGDRSVGLHFFDLLIENRWNKLQPGLAESWKIVDPLTWEFTLRPGVTWHDGRPFAADDVVFSYARAPKVPGSVAPFASFLRTVASTEAVDARTIRVRTKEPNPLLLLNLASVHIVSRHATEGVQPEDWSGGRAVVGTGPYRLVSYSPNERIAMRRHDGYWGDKPQWERVDYRYVSNPAARTAALLAGDVDVIDKVAVADIARLKASPDVTVQSYPGLRAMLLQPSFTPGPNRFALAADGKPLPDSPLLDVRVRRALNVAINRPALVDRLMQGAAKPASQWMPEGTFGYEPAIPQPAFDPEAARKLLTEAGYPAGFQLTIHVPTDRYLAGSETGQAVAQMWSRIGVRTSLETVPWAVYAGRAPKGEYAVTMVAWGNGTGEASYGLASVLATVEPSRGQGAANWGRYSNAEADRALWAATAEFDEAKREDILRGAARTVDADMGVFAIFHYDNVWAARRGLTVTPMTSDRTVAQMVTGR